MNTHDKTWIQYQLEMVVELIAQADRLDMDGCDITHLSTQLFKECSDRVWAALYMLQASDGGPRPKNYGKVLERVAEIDSGILMRIVIDDARDASRG